MKPEEQSALDRKLIAAAWKNDLSEAGRLIEEGADVNAKDDSVQSAYLISTSEGYVELLGSRSSTAQMSPASTASTAPG